MLEAKRHYYIPQFILKIYLVILRYIPDKKRR